MLNSDFSKNFEEFKPPHWMFSKHLETIIPSMMRKNPTIELERERLELDDGDFLDLDWKKVKGKSLAILSHGLEGSSRRPYTLGMIETLAKAGIDSLAWNCRSCSEEMNRLPRLYHHADWEDIDSVIMHAADVGYEEIHLIGFSMGGNLSLHWLHEYPEKARSLINKAVIFSAPLDLKSSALHLMKSGNILYRNRFMGKLKQKIRDKAMQYPQVYDTSHLPEIRSFYEFDDTYTAPIHGFDGADDFYHQGSTYYKLPRINTDTLLVQARNDPFFPISCYPSEKEINNKKIISHYPKYGGHVGFTIQHNKRYYSEELALKFIRS